MGSTVTGTYAYGTEEDVYRVYQQLPDSAAEVQQLIENVRTDGMVVLEDGTVVALPLLIEAAAQKFGLMAVAGKILAYFAGYPNITFNITLETFLKTETMMQVIAQEVIKHNVSIDDIDSTAYQQKIYSEFTANPKIFKEAYYAQIQSNPNNALMNQLAYGSMDNNGNLQSPLKGKAPKINLALLLFLARTGQVGLMMMMLYRHNSQMSSAMSWNLMGVLNMHNKLKRDIMKQIAKVGKEAPDDPAVAQRLHEIQTRLGQLKSSEDVVTSILAETKEDGRNFFELTQRVLQIENATVLAAARA